MKYKKRSYKGYSSLLETAMSTISTIAN